MASLSSDKTIMDTQAPLAKRQKMNGNGYGFDVGVNYGEGSVSYQTSIMYHSPMSWDIML